MLELYERHEQLDYHTPVKCIVALLRYVLSKQGVTSTSLRLALFKALDELLI